nr:hypothetical protein [Pseudoalteromonas sp. WY3]
MSQLPSRLFRKNRVAKAVDEVILSAYKKDLRYNFIKKDVPLLATKTKPAAFKEISKVLYVNDITPPVSKQGHDAKTVLGATGEALTELLFAEKPDLDSNNRGFDLKIDASLVEVKSTVEDKVSLSNVQYEKSDYLIIHIFHKYRDLYLFSYLVPMRILREIKGDKNGRVSINIYKEKWVEKFKITPIRIAQYFKIRERYITGKTRALVHVANRDVLDKKIIHASVHVQAIFEMYSSFNAWKWEINFVYYEYFYHQTLDWVYTYDYFNTNR